MFCLLPCFPKFMPLRSFTLVCFGGFVPFHQFLRLPGQGFEVNLPVWSSAQGLSFTAALHFIAHLRLTQDSHMSRNFCHPAIPLLTQAACNPAMVLNLLTLLAVFTVLRLLLALQLASCPCGPSWSISARVASLTAWPRHTLGRKAAASNGART